MNVIEDIPFETSNPYPLHALGSYSYAAAKRHAEKVDQFLGFEIPAIEAQIVSRPRSTNQEIWSGLSAQSFQTPYLEIRSLLQLMDIQPGQAVVDLGCAYGRLAFVMAQHFPQNPMLGYELVPDRVHEVWRVFKKHPCPLARIELLDLQQSPPEIASHYFIYDFGSQTGIDKCLGNLRDISRSKKIQVVARGKGTRFLIHKSHPWLGEVQPPQHFEHFSIYKS